MPSDFSSIVTFSYFFLLVDTLFVQHERNGYRHYNTFVWPRRTIGKPNKYAAMFTLKQICYLQTGKYVCASRFAQSKAQAHGSKVILFKNDSNFSVGDSFFEYF